MRAKVRLREQDQPLERNDWVALRTQVQSDEVCLPVRENRDRRRLRPEMTAVVDFGQGGLNGAVATVDDQYLRADASDGTKRVADLLGPLDLVMEDVRMVGAIVADARKLRNIPRRLRVLQQCDPWTGHLTR